MTADADRARVLFAAGRWAQVVAETGRMLQADPDDAEALLLLAQAQLRLDDPSAALAAARQATRLRPDIAEPLVVQSAALLDLLRGDEAVQAADAALGLAPQSAWALTHRVSVDAGLGRRSEAGDAAAAALLRVAPGDAGTHVALGLLAQSRGDTARARAAFERALRIDPDRAEARYRLSQLDAGSGRYRRGLAQLRGLIRADPTDERFVQLFRKTLLGPVVGMCVALAVVGLLVSPGVIADEPTGIAVAWAFGGWVLLVVGAVAFVVHVGGRAALPLLFTRRRGIRVLMGIATAFLALGFVALLGGALTAGPSDTAGPLAAILGLLAVTPVALSSVFRVAQVTVRPRRVPPEDRGKGLRPGVRLALSAVGGAALAAVAIVVAVRLTVDGVLPTAGPFVAIGLAPLLLTLRAAIRYGQWRRGHRL